jgi:hypothetical protein
MNTGRSIVRALVAVATLLLAAAPTWAGDDTTGKVSIESTSVAAGFGVAWGHGVLEYHGQKYPFTVTGFSIGDVGVARVFASGEVHNLKNVEDFTGMFMAAVASATLGGGAGAAAMQNQKGVGMVWTATNQGVSFTLAPAGINVKLADTAQHQAAKSRRNASAGGPPVAVPGR